MNFKTISINGYPINVIPTTDINESVEMINAILLNGFDKMAIITGDPGTGKTVSSHFLASHFNGYRIHCHANLTPKSFLLSLARSMGHELPKRLTTEGIFDFVKSQVNGNIFFVDEANHLNIKSLELTRDLSDEYGATFVLFGTDVLTQLFKDKHSSTYLAQLESRVGTKIIQFKPIRLETEEDYKKVVAYFIAPVFENQKIGRQLIEKFYKYCGGNWRTARELAMACVHHTRKNECKLTADVVDFVGNYLLLNRTVIY